MRRLPDWTLAVFAIAIAAALASPAVADDLADFYRSKPVTLTVSSSAGGGYDTLARTLARFLGRHLPGNPIVFVRNMAGPGGMGAANALFAAERDGSQIGLLQNTTPFEPLLGGIRDIRFDPTKFEWLGTPSVETGLVLVWSTVPVTTLDDVRQRETTVGAAGNLSPPAVAARLFNEVFGTRFKIVNGFPGLTEALYGMERGRIEGYPSALYSALQVTKADWLPQGTIKALLAYGPEKPAALKDVPFASELAANPDDKILLDVAFAPLALGRPLAMPPGVPPDRVAAMRKALADTFADPAFQAESERLALGASAPRDGPYLADVIRRSYAAKPDIVDRLRRLTRPPPALNQIERAPGP
jgi:tripartite-type tricarboxylate transporter receptor subunit TctC